jgi:hypothetical protein
VVTDIARHGAREEVIVVTDVPVARRRPRTQVDVAGELERALAQMEFPPEGEPLKALGRASLWSPGHCELAAVLHDPSVLLVHACSKHRSGP